MLVNVVDDWPVCWRTLSSAVQRLLASVTTMAGGNRDEWEYWGGSCLCGYTVKITNRRSFESLENELNLTRWVDSGQRKWTDCVSVRQEAMKGCWLMWLGDCCMSCWCETFSCCENCTGCNAARLPVMLLMTGTVCACDVFKPGCENNDVSSEECMTNLKWKARWLDTHFVRWPWLQKGALWGCGSVGACGGMHGCWSGCWLEEDLRLIPRSEKKMQQ